MPARKKSRKKRRSAVADPELDAQIVRLREILALMSQSAGIAALGAANPRSDEPDGEPGQSAGGGESRPASASS